MQPIEADALERESKLGDRVRIIAADPGRPSRQFGSGLVNRILKEDALPLPDSGSRGNFRRSDIPTAI
jgi:hypothetical protein